MNKNLKRMNLQALKQYAKATSELAAGALSSISAASERKQLAPTRFDKMETRILKMLAGWSIAEIEALLVDRVVLEAKRRAKLP